MNHSKSTRFLAMLLAVVMVIGYMPVSAFATENAEEIAAPETATVSFDVNGGVGEYEDQVVTIGEKVAKPEQDPTYESYEFAHWTADLEKNIAWSFEENAVTEDMTLYAAWAAPAEAANEVTTEEGDEEVTTEGGDDEVITEEGDDEVTTEEGDDEVQPVTYTVNYYKWDWEQEADVLMETEELTGIPGNLTEAQAKEFEGLMLMDDIVQAEIAADGSTVVDVFYIVELDTAAFVGNSKLYDTSVSKEYFKVISENSYDLAPGAVEHEIVLNSAKGDDRKVAHVIEVDPNETEIEILPGYYEIDKFDPNDTTTWKTAGVTVVADYYANTLGLNVVGAMNTALQYTNNAPYGFMVYNGQVLANNDLAKGAQTYLAVIKNDDGTVEFDLRSISEPLTGNEWQAVSANFGWLVKDGELTTKTVGRTDSDASRSMLGIKADGSLVICQVDGRNAPTSTGLSSYEMGEMMLALGCVYAVNGDGGGSSSFVTKRSGSDELVMRSVPSDGSERPTINSIIVVSKAGASGEFAEVLFETEYNYIAPGASMAVSVTGLDTKNFIMDIPAEVTYQVANDMGTIENGVFTAGNATGDATIQAVYNGIVVSEKVLKVVHPETFGFTAETTALPLDKTLELELVAKYGEDDWEVCIDGAYTMTLPEENLGSSLNGNVMTPPSDPAMEMKTVVVTVTYNPDKTKTDTISVMFGEASKVIWDFEDGDRAGFVGFQEAKQWSIDNGVNNTLIGSDPLGGQFNSYLGSKTSMATAANGGQVRNGEYALAWTLDNTDTNFANWSYNVLFNVGEKIVFRDTDNGQNATSLGMWLYIPEGATGLAFQSQFWGTLASDGSTGCKQDHFTFTSAATGKATNLNSATEADIPANRWVYASIDISKYSYLSTMDPTETASNSRSPSFVRTYVKPNGPAVHTFYIDDITLDYSSAVDDRVAPVIGDIQYATSDTAVNVENATLNTNKASFSAEVSDNTSLDNASAQIYIDGNKVATQVQGKYMSTVQDVVMDNGSHVVTFEISDKLGNEFQTSARFTVNYAEAELEKGLVYVTGHNDSGAPAEADSIYYVDIMTSDIAQIDNVELNIKLNSANTWELEHAAVAEGFTFEYEVLSLDDRYTTFALTSDIHSTDNVAVVTITKTGDCSLTGEQTLVSLPVRLWSWDAWNHVTDSAQNPLANKPTVTIDYNVLFGCAETVSGEYVSFGGSGSVTTNMNYGGAAWHTHDEKLTALNKKATCTVDGYENRTYCETCKSVVDWGTKVPAKDHTYKVVEDQLVCECSEILGGNGLVTANDKIYVLIADKLVTGWQMVEDGWCYADPTTKEVKTGEFTVNKMTYTADETGVVVKGAWTTDSKGTKYSYGPAFYNREWAEIDGAKYYFGTDSYVYTGLRFIAVNRNNIKEGYRVYKFAEDGKLEDEMLDANGLITSDVDGMFYVENGTSVYGGLILIDGDYYYARTSGQVVCNDTYWITKNNDLLPVANYTFGVDGKMLNPPVTEEPDPEQPDVPEVKNGIVEEDGKLWWYVNNVKTYGGLMLIDGDYYYARSSGEIVVGKTYWPTKTNDLLPAANYTFGADGKMLNPPVTEEPDPEPNPDPDPDPEPDIPVVKNGIVEENGKLWWYVNDVKTYGGLMLIDGDYYYARSSGEILTNTKYWITKHNDLLPAANYTFDADGKMVNPPVTPEPDPEPDTPVVPEPPVEPVKKNGIVEEGGKLWWYVDDVKTYGGLMLVDGNYYYARTSGEILTNVKYWISKTNDLLPAANYTFDADGKMVNPPVAK